MVSLSPTSIDHGVSLGGLDPAVPPRLSVQALSETVASFRAHASKHLGLLRAPWGQRMSGDGKLDCHLGQDGQRTVVMKANLVATEFEAWLAAGIQAVRSEQANKR